MSNVFDGVPTEALINLLHQAHSTGGTLAPALQDKLEELSDVDETEEFKSISRILRQAHEGVSSS